MSRKAISNKVKTGHIVLDANGLIDVQAADKRDKEMLHPRKGNRSKRTPQPDSEANNFSYTEVLRLKEFYKAKRERIAYRKEIGQLVLKESVEKEAFEMARIMRDNLLNVPNRISGEIAAELGLKPGEGQEQVFQILNREILQILEGLTAHETPGTTKTLTP